jgi:hypothetical protein
MTTQELLASDTYRTLPPLGLAFLDGMHTAEQAAIDWEAVQPKLAPGAVVCFHDSFNQKASPMYGPGRAYRCSVGRFLDTLRARDDLQVFDLPLGPGLTLVRRTP